MSDLHLEVQLVEDAPKHLETSPGSAQFQDNPAAARHSPDGTHIRENYVPNTRCPVSRFLNRNQRDTFGADTSASSVDLTSDMLRFMWARARRITYEIGMLFAQGIRRRPSRDMHRSHFFCSLIPPRVSSRL